MLWMVTAEVHPGRAAGDHAERVAFALGASTAAMLALEALLLA